MYAHLIALAGPLQGAVFPLPDEGFTVGREDTNLLCLTADRAVSRQHCVIDKDNGQFTLRDLHSANGTYINNVAVTERPLQHGDEIRIGRSIFVFVEDGRPTPHTCVAVDFEEGGVVPATTLALRREDVAYARAEAIVDAAAESKAVA